MHLSSWSTHSHTRYRDKLRSSSKWKKVLIENPDFDVGHVEIAGRGQKVVVEGLAGLGSASVEALVEEESKLSVVEAYRQRSF